MTKPFLFFGVVALCLSVNVLAFAQKLQKESDLSPAEKQYRLYCDKLHDYKLMHDFDRKLGVYDNPATKKQWDDVERTRVELDRLVKAEGVVLPVNPCQEVN
jgi:hypothetical protein